MFGFLLIGRFCFWNRNVGLNFFFWVGKDILWEGGVKGVGFVYIVNDFIKQKNCVCIGLIDVIDWVVILYYLGGGDVEFILVRIDGKNVWEMILNDVLLFWDEVLYNIDFR